MSMRHCIAGGVGIALMAIASGVGSPAWGSAASVDRLHENLLRAICLNDWTGAIAIVNPLIASPNLTNAYRQSLVDLRYALNTLREERAIVPDIALCETVLRRYVTAGEVPKEPLDWPNAVASVLLQEPVPALANQADQPRARAALDLDRFEVYDIPALSPALPINLSTGVGVSAGTVAQGERVYTFFAGLGDRITVDVEVTRVLPGSIFPTGDTQLFLFDATGRLVADNDDAKGNDPRLEEILLPRTGRYYVVVTNYNNDPILDEAGHVVGWLQTGSGAVEYTLALTGATPTAELILTNYGP